MIELALAFYLGGIANILLNIWVSRLREDYRTIPLRWNILWWPLVYAYWIPKLSRDGRAIAHETG